jgi:hypothetical protein
MLPIISRLPSPIAIPLNSYWVEQNPVLQIHRMCDAAELLTRFLTIIALAELRRSLGDAPLPKTLLDRLQGDMERPTFGRWRGMLAAVLDHLPSVDGLVVPVLAAVTRKYLLPRLDGTDAPIDGLIELRNDLVHGGALSEAAARRLLSEHVPQGRGASSRRDECKAVTCRTNRRATDRPGAPRTRSKAPCRRSCNCMQAGCKEGGAFLVCDECVAAGQGEKAPDEGEP